MADFLKAIEVMVASIFGNEVIIFPENDNNKEALQMEEYRPKGKPLPW